MSNEINRALHHHLLTIQETADRLGVSPRTVRRLIAEGKVHTYRIRRAIRISDKDIHDYLRTARN